MAEESKQLVLISEAIKQMQEKYRVHVTHATMINWCSKHGVGIQLGGAHGRWHVDMDKLFAYVETEAKNDTNS